MKTRIIAFLISGVVLVGLISTINFSYSQSFEGPVGSDRPILVFVETFVRNSDGQLITYLTSSKFTYVDWFALDTLLDNETNENDPVFELNGINYQLIRRQQVIAYDSESSIASTLLARTLDDGTPQIVARFAHDGYPILPGEQVTSIWTFIRPVN